MSDNKKKTRHELLRELESIKGLLKEDNDEPEQRDIPILEEIFTPQPESADVSRASPADSLKREELAALKSAYQSLLADAELFTDEASEAHARKNTPTANKPPAPEEATSTTSPSANNVLPGQQPLFGGGGSDGDRERQQALLSSYGENPFLPQHIRARLRGNRTDLNASQSEGSAGDKLPPGKTPPLSRDSLINELIQQVIPQLEQRLRDQLQRMSAEDIKTLLSEKEDPQSRR